MIALFLLIFGAQNAIATGELNLNNLHLTVVELNGRMNKLEAEVNDLKSEVKVWVVETRKKLSFSTIENNPF